MMNHCMNMIIVIKSYEKFANIKTIVFIIE